MRRACHAAKGPRFDIGFDVDAIEDADVDVDEDLDGDGDLHVAEQLGASRRRGAAGGPHRRGSWAAVDQLPLESPCGPPPRSGPVGSSPRIASPGSGAISATSPPAPRRSPSAFIFL